MQSHVPSYSILSIIFLRFNVSFLFILNYLIYSPTNN
jgi:hypothetical protein